MEWKQALVFDPQRMTSAAAFGAEVSEFVAWVQSAALAPGASAILMPGDPERAMRVQRAEFMPVDAATLAELDEAAAAVNRAQGSRLAPLSAQARKA